MAATMDETRKSVMAAALSLYAEQLARDQAVEELSSQQAKGKGKSRARDEDLELERVREEELRICRELGSRLLGEAGDSDDDDGGVGLTGKGKGKEEVRNFSRKKSEEFVREDELQPYVNPFTGLPVVPETGFEAGPSWRAPPPLKVAMRRGSGDRDRFPDEREVGGREGRVDSPAAGGEKGVEQGGIERTESISRKPVAVRRDTRQVERGGDATYSTNEWKGSTRPLPWDEYRPAEASASKSKWFRNITEFGSKALKTVTGSHKQSTPRSYRFSSRETFEDLPSEPPSYEYMPAHTTSSIPDLPQTKSSQRRPSQDTLPPAYDALSSLSRRSSTTSVSSAGQSSVVRSPSILSRTDTLSPNTTGGSFASGMNDGDTWKRLSKGGSSRSTLAEQKASSRSPTTFRDISYSFTPNVNASGTSWRESIHRDSMSPNQSSMRHSFGHGREAANPGASSSTTTLESIMPPPSRRNSSQKADSPSKKRGSRFGSPAYHNRSPSPVPFPPVSEDTFATSASNSNNPWREHISDDEAFARSLQQEEYHELQVERDILLAMSLENGTAEDGDVELANYMAREMETLLALSGTSHRTTTAHTTTTYSPEISSLTTGLSQLELDILAAQSLDRELNASSSSAADANLAAAMQIQATFDAEAEGEEAWEEWKKSNIEECVICGDEHGKDMLVRPCEHGYCGGCLKEGFEGALKAKTPLKCCNKVLDIGECEGLDTAFVGRYKEMVIELTANNPAYCHARKCGVFLPPRMFVGDVGTCEKCKAKTCKHCRQKVHLGRFCEEDQDTKAVKELGRRKGWKTCPGCNHLIERQDGCLHMVCTRCQTAFCYRCSKKWKDCESTCPDPISATHPKI